MMDTKEKAEQVFRDMTTEEKIEFFKEYHRADMKNFGKLTWEGCDLHGILRSIHGVFDPWVSIGESSDLIYEKIVEEFACNYVELAV